MKIDIILTFNVYTFILRNAVAAMDQMIALCLVLIIVYVNNLSAKDKQHRCIFLTDAKVKLKKLLYKLLTL